MNLQMTLVHHVDHFRHVHSHAYDDVRAGAYVHAYHANRVALDQSSAPRYHLVDA
jgi:hypothetical protein